jgi:hypothetical protein
MTTLEQPLRGAPGTGTGEIWRVAGPVVVARGLPGVRLYTSCASATPRCPAR